MSELSDAERQEAREWLARMMGEPQAHSAGLEAWLSGNNARRAYYDRLLAGLGQATTGAHLTNMRARNGVRKNAWGPFRSAFQLRGALAASVIVITMTSLGYEFLRKRENLAVADQRLTTIRTRIGEVRPMRLADGTVVTLDSGTIIVVDTIRDQRKVVLRQGRARFAVAERQEPFRVVEGDNSVATAKGTFDVSDREGFMAHVIEGAADVRLQPAALVVEGASAIRLMPGQKLVFTSGQDRLPTAIAARPSDQQWIGGVKSLNDVPIKEVIAEANTYSEIKIVLANPALGDKVIFGDLHIRDIEGVATAIADYLHLKVDRSRPNTLLLIAPN